MSKKDDALKLALEAMENNVGEYRVDGAKAIIREALAEQPAISADPITPAMTQGITPEQKAQMVKIIMGDLAEQPAQQEPVADTLCFAQWTADKKDLSDYILVGSLSLAGIEDGEYGTSEIDPFDNTIEALQEKLVTGSDHKKVPLLAYIGALTSTSPQPAQPSKPWVGLTDIEIQNCFQPRSKDKTKERRLIAEQIVKKVLEKLV